MGERSLPQTSLPVFLFVFALHIDEAYERVRRPGRTYEPDKSLTGLYARTFETYKNIYPALKPLNHRIFDAFKG